MDCNKTISIQQDKIQSHEICFIIFSPEKLFAFWYVAKKIKFLYV